MQVKGGRAPGGSCSAGQHMLDTHVRGYSKAALQLAMVHCLPPGTSTVWPRCLLAPPMLRHAAPRCATLPPCSRLWVQANLLSQCLLVYLSMPSVVHAYQVYRAEEVMYW